MLLSALTVPLRTPVVLPLRLTDAPTTGVLAEVMSWVLLPLYSHTLPDLAIVVLVYRTIP